MLTAALPRNLHFFKKPQTLSDYSKKIFSGNNYFGRNAYYRAILYQYVNFGSYINIFNTSGNLKPLQTSIDIQPRVIGADTKKVLAKYGKPVFTLNENKLTIFVYKMKFNGLKTRCEIHFYDNMAFLINYHYSQLNNTDKDFIIQSVADKYIDQDIHDIKNSKIIDSKGNIVYINDILEGINITYLGSKESVWYRGLTTEIDARKEKENSKIKLEKKLFYNSI